jgi:N-acetylglutamate synthase-like GNAT family acetyltransferase|tara:strand:- start:234 stop:701 length:468 start_codon:yes stop_codon:yes gene_type:complete
MKIRKAQIRDLNEIDEIYQEGQIDEEKNIPSGKNEKEILKELDETKKIRLNGFKKAINSSKEKFLVCEEKDELIGFGDAVLSNKKRGAEVSLIYVKRKYRRQGVGKKLLRELLKWLKEKGESKVFVTTNIENNSSISLNKQAGFRTSIVIMEKKL